MLVLSPPETRWRKDDSQERLGTGSLLPVVSAGWWMIQKYWVAMGKFDYRDSGTT